MPIRFRCQYCNQLLGIARRKAGTNVRCPTCQNDVGVPFEDQPDDSHEQSLEPEFGPADAPTYQAPSAQSPLNQSREPSPVDPPGVFDRDDFDNLLNQNVSIIAPAARSGVRAAAPAAANRPAPIAASSPSPVTPEEPTIGKKAKPTTAPTQTKSSPIRSPSAGLVISPARATLLTVIVILLLAISFAAGLIIGRFVL